MGSEVVGSTMRYGNDYKVTGVYGAAEDLPEESRQRTKNRRRELVEAMAEKVLRIA